MTAHGLRWAAADTWTITLRELQHWARHPGQIAVNLLFPVMMVVMFGYLLGGGMYVPGGGDYREFLMPGMFVMTMVFGVEATYAAVAADATKGVTDRFRTLPMSGGAVLAGRAAADLLNSALGLAVMVASGFVVGWAPHRGAPAAVAAFGLLMLLRLAFLWAGTYLGLLTTNPEALMAVQILVWPFGFLSSVFAAPETMPGVLAALAEWNPISATVAATRELFGNPGFGGGSWPARHAIALAIAWPVAAIAVLAPLSVRRYRRLGR